MLIRGLYCCSRSQWPWPCDPAMSPDDVIQGVSSRSRWNIPKSLVWRVYKPTQYGITHISPCNTSAWPESQASHGNHKVRQKREGGRERVRERGEQRVERRKDQRGKQREEELSKVKVKFLFVAISWIFLGICKGSHCVSLNTARVSNWTRSRIEPGSTYPSKLIEPIYNSVSIWTLSQFEPGWF